MTEIKTAQAWGHYGYEHSKMLSIYTFARKASPSEMPVVIVHGLTEAEVHEAAELLARSREVCEQKKITHDGPYQFRAFGGDCDNDHYAWNDPKECPSCGRKVVVK